MNDNQKRDQQEVMAVLEPYFARISGLYAAAVKLYNEGTSAQARAEHDNRAALSAIYRHTWVGYQREFLEEKGFHFLTVRGLNVLNIRDKVVLRPKRVDANGVHTNSKTNQQRNFDSQQPLPGIPSEASRVVVGYELDPAFSVVERMIVRSPSNRWAAQVVVVDDTYAWQDITPTQLPFETGQRKLG